MIDEPDPAVDTEPVDSIEDGDEPLVLRARVVDLYRRGKTFQQVGDELGFSRQRACFLYWDAMRNVQQQAVEAQRAEMTEQIAEVVRVASEIMNSDHYAHSNGKVVLDPETEAPLHDSAPRLDAGRTIIAALGRLAKLVGADAPAQVETSGSVRYEVVGINPEDVT